MDQQQTFDRVARHLLTQGRKSVAVDDATHRYRGPAGMRCAIGCLIPDRLYDERMEGLSVLHAGIYLTFGAGREDVAFLDGLQRVHDCHGANRWPDVLKMVAWQFDLSSNAVEETR